MESMSWLKTLKDSMSSLLDQVTGWVSCTYPMAYYGDSKGSLLIEESVQ